MAYLLLITIVSGTVLLPWSENNGTENSFLVLFSALGIILQKFTIFPLRFFTSGPIFFNYDSVYI